MISTARRLSQLLVRLICCASLAFVTSGTSSALYETIRTLSEIESGSRSVNTGQSELLHADSAQRRSDSQRPHTVEKQSESDSRRLRAAFIFPAHWHFQQTHQFNAIGCPLIC